ncbi:uncharacterized protein LOC107042731 [Diachasma alloeum]|uniref:uncharacterized protein LOC107042731 n=1 Tax=Diachasma alloeum TaxID=454923 RepID=UPI00073843C5|nr:uncharacterized protein LOC107042731 [Diachasma alloeum]
MEEADPLGFTKHTAMILEGLNAQDLIPEFKKRSIPTDALPELSKEDLVVLGASEELAEKLQKQFRSKVRKIEPIGDHDEEKIGKILDILKKGRQQLYLIDTFLLYSRRKLMESSGDYLIDRNLNERASEALVMAIKSTLGDLERVERQYKELSSFINEESDAKSSKAIKYSLLTAAAVLTCFMFTWKICKELS